VRHEIAAYLNPCPRRAAGFISVTNLPEVAFRRKRRSASLSGAGLPPKHPTTHPTDLRDAERLPRRPCLTKPTEPVGRQDHHRHRQDRRIVASGRMLAASAWCVRRLRAISRPTAVAIAVTVDSVDTKFRAAGLTGDVGEECKCGGPGCALGVCGSGRGPARDQRGIAVDRCWCRGRTKEMTRGGEVEHHVV
jgi:hypothetical protein